MITAPWLLTYRIVEDKRVRELAEVLGCDDPGCGAEISGPSSKVATRAIAQGWQVDAATHVQHYGDTVSVSRTDRCPDHHVSALAPEELLKLTGQTF